MFRFARNTIRLGNRDPGQVSSLRMIPVQTVSSTPLRFAPFRSAGRFPREPADSSENRPPLGQIPGNPLFSTPKQCLLSDQEAF